MLITENSKVKVLCHNGDIYEGSLTHLCLDIGEKYGRRPAPYSIKSIKVLEDAPLDVTERKPSVACQEYLKAAQVSDMSIPDAGRCFVNDFDEAMIFKTELIQLIPDLKILLSSPEIDALTDFIYGKTCEDLRKKGLLSEESRRLLGR